MGRQASVFLCLILLFLPLSARAGWYTDCKQCEAHLGGDSRMGPFATQSACEDARQLNHSFPYRACFQEGGDDTQTSSDSSLQDATSRALAHGLVNGDSQTFGVGLLGLGAMAILNGGNSQPSAADLEAQRQQELQRQANLRAAAAAAEERRRRFEAGKQEALGELKGSDAAVASVDDGLKGDDEMKDACCASRKKGKKKWSPPHLKAVGDPLHKQPIPGDAVGVLQYFDTWAEADACGGLAAMDHSKGKIVCCPEGYPYYCSGKCYREAALDDFRIPCDDTLRTDKQTR